MTVLNYEELSPVQKTIEVEIPVTAAANFGVTFMAQPTEPALHRRST